MCMSQNRNVWINRDYELCSGCRRCEVACSLFHEKQIWPEASRVRVFMLIPGIEIPHLCFQCDDPECVEACPEGALSVDEQVGGIRVDESRCTACGICIDACPGRIPHMHPREDRIVICDLCGGNPECVRVCQEGKWNALSLGEEGMKKPSPETPQSLTHTTGSTILGEQTLREVWDQ
jgi:carbon-monoxide dehydrogenase iron sulfur subunit